jgi:ribose transport system ATP-binding protein
MIPVMPVIYKVCSMTGGVILEAKGIVKKFPGVVALNNMDISVSRGEIRAIMGENGAGKSTLCNIITGLYAPSEGEIWFKGKKTAFTHPHDALKAGIRMVYQERNLIGFLTGAQSICLGLEDKKYGVFTDEKTMINRSRQIVNDIGANVPVDEPVNKLSSAQQQMIEIIRAVAHQPELLIMDEPTAALGNEEVEMLFSVVRKLKALGVAVLIITHKLEEVFQIADTISILRNGQHIVTARNGEINRKEVVKHMLGRDIMAQYPVIENNAKDDVCLEVQNLACYSGKLSGVSFSVKKGEVLGIYGLLGSGRTEIMENIFGLRKRKSGTVTLYGKQFDKVYPAQMIAEGVVFIPEDRRNNSVISRFMTLEQNISLGYLDKCSNSIGLVNKKKEDDIFREIAHNPGLRVKYADKNQDIGDLSGGNQQKIILGRWIFRENLKLAMLDEPTQGIDVGVKHDIYELIRELAKKGISVLIVSSELPELTGICDRIVILKNGIITNCFTRDEMNDESILGAVL